MSGKYINGTMKMMSGGLDLIKDDLIVLLIDSSLYTYSLDNDVSLSNIPPDAVISESPLEGKALVGLTESNAVSLQASNTVFNDVEADREASTLVISVAANTNEFSYLVGAIDITPLTTTGEPVIVEWVDSNVLGY